MIQLGERIKELRRRDGRTQDALANELGVTAQAVSRWEKGICYPDMEMIPPIANYSRWTLFAGLGYRFPRRSCPPHIFCRRDKRNDGQPKSASY